MKRNSFEIILICCSCCSKDGYLFDKEAILQYIITKKTEYAKKLKEYERQRQLEDNEVSEANALEEQKKLMKFINTEKNVITPKGERNYFAHGIALFLTFSM